MPELKITKRALDNTSTAETAKTTSDLKVTGNPDAWVLISKASSKSQGWMKSTKVMEVREGNSFCGCLVQVSTEHRDPVSGDVITCAEALTFLPGAKLAYFTQER